MLTSPAFATTTTGPSTAASSAASAARSTAPPGAGTSRTLPRPKPRVPRVLRALAWISVLEITGIGGRPPRPSWAASNPRPAPVHCRAAARPIRLAIVAPLVSAPAQAAGRPNSSFSQRSTVSSVWAAAGLLSHIPAFWSMAEASSPPASAAGVLPPLTNPKKRGPPDATIPGSARANQSLTASAGSQPVSGSGSSSAAPISAGPGRRLTGRSGKPVRYADASSCARASAACVVAKGSDGWVTESTRDRSVVVMLPPW